MIVLAIDPGPTQSAYAVLESLDHGKTLTVVEFAKTQSSEVLAKFYDQSFMKSVDAVVCEEIQSYGQAVGREVFETVHWCGRFHEASIKSTELIMVPRREVKLHHCGRTTANDSNIRAQLIDRFGKPGVKKNPGLFYGVTADCWQAIALGVYWLDTAKAKL